MTVQIWTFLKYENNVIHRQFHPKIGPNLGIFMTELNTPLYSAARLRKYLANDFKSKPGIID